MKMYAIALQAIEIGWRRENQQIFESLCECNISQFCILNRFISVFFFQMDLNISNEVPR